MSLMEPAYAARDPIHSKPNRDKPYTESTSGNPQTQTHHRQDSYDDAIFQEFYQMDEPTTTTTHMQNKTQNTTMAAAIATTTITAEVVSAPPLPQKNTLRSSRLLDNMGLKLGGALESHRDDHLSMLNQATPHDVYLSSEEDASSSADDFSDYDWESGSEYGGDDEAEPSSVSPSTSANSSPVAGSRRSHEITARVVSVVFAGKPAMIDLSAPGSKRSGSPTGSSKTAASAAAAAAAAPTTTSANTGSSNSSVISVPAVATAITTNTPTSMSASTAPARPSPAHRPESTVSSAASSSAHRLSVSSTASSAFTTGQPATTAAPAHPPRQSSMLASILTKQKPHPFLNIDPYANGSTYSLELPAKATTNNNRNNAAVEEDSPTQPRTPKTPTAMFRDLSRSFGLARKRSRPMLHSNALVGETANSPNRRDSMVVAASPVSPALPSNASTSNLVAAGLQQQQQRPQTAMPLPQRASTVPVSLTAQPGAGSPVSPTPTERKGGRWSGFSVRRASIKLTGKLL